jgi:hypothetical protein
MITVFGVWEGSGRGGEGRGSAEKTRTNGLVSLSVLSRACMEEAGVRAPGSRKAKEGEGRENKNSRKGDASGGLVDA